MSRPYADCSSTSSTRMTWPASPPPSTRCWPACTRVPSVPEDTRTRQRSPIAHLGNEEQCELTRERGRTMASVRQIATTTALVLVTSLGLTAYAGPSASASSKPPPTDQGRHHSNRSKLAPAPDHRRNPGLKAILSEKDAD